MLCWKYCWAQAFDIPSFGRLLGRQGSGIVIIFAWKFSRGSHRFYGLKRSKSNLKLGIFRELPYIISRYFARVGVIHTLNFFFSHDKYIILWLGFFLWYIFLLICFVECMWSLCVADVRTLSSQPRENNKLIVFKQVYKQISKSLDLVNV